jgi:hypothetical protein
LSIIILNNFIQDLLAVFGRFGLLGGGWGWVDVIPLSVGNVMERGPVEISGSVRVMKSHIP